MDLEARNSKKAHAICIPYPAQGHVTPMLKLAKLLHQNGFHITFVNTQYNHRRLLRSQGCSLLTELSDFRFATIPDGLPYSDGDVTQDIPSLCVSTATTCLKPFCELISELNRVGPPVSCIVGDGVMSFTLEAAERFQVPEVLFWTASACGFLEWFRCKSLVQEGVIRQIKDMNKVRTGSLETILDPSVERKDIMFNFFINETEAASRAKALIINTFHTLEHDVLDALSAMLPRVYTIGPLQLMMSHVHDEKLNSFGSNLWKEDSNCIKWLNRKEPQSVVYVNFGSLIVVTAEQLVELAWGLANSKKSFLWIIRPDLVAGDNAMLPHEFVEETKDRGILTSWCSQEEVLKHPAVGGFLTHSGWNSTIESIVGGVPMICWPSFTEQQANCRYCCDEWGIGMEIDNDVRRDEVESLVKELMDGEKGKRMKDKAKEWKRKAEEASVPSGSSYLNLDKMIKQVLLS